MTDPPPLLNPPLLIHTPESLVNLYEQHKEHPSISKIHPFTIPGIGDVTDKIGHDLPHNSLKHLHV